MVLANASVTGKNLQNEEETLRVDLAAAFRLAVHFDWHESVANHFSASLGDNTKTILLNPRWRHFSKVRASELLKLDTDDTEVMNRSDAPDPSAWCIHGAIHRVNPSARVLLHCHPPYSTALSALKDPTIKPIDQTTALFFNRVANDLNFGGIADDDQEGERLAGVLGDKTVLMMGNHGVSVVGNNVAEAFEKLYNFERAARTMMLAYATGQPLNIMSDNLAEKTAAAWEDYTGMAHAHFAELKAMLDETQPDYKL